MGLKPVSFATKPISFYRRDKGNWLPVNIPLRLTAPVELLQEIIS